MKKEIIANYVTIFEKIEKENLRVRNEENKKLACYFFNKGELYDGKLMVIGRAGNGCEEESCWKQGDSKARSIEQFVENTYSHQMQWSLRWVTEWWGRNEVNDKDEKLYNSATPFWKLIKAVLKGIDKSQWDEENWPLKIVWSNIFKVSPMNGGNPNYTLQKLQLDFCKEILKIEIESCKPRNILFVTGDDWFKYVESLFIIDESNFIYKYADGTVANVYICERPEFKSPSMMAEKIISQYKSQIRGKIS